MTRLVVVVGGEELVVEEAGEDVADEDLELALFASGVAKASACTLSERTGCLGGAKRPSRSGMVDRHDVDEFASDAVGVLLLDELGEDAFEIGELRARF